MSIAQPKGLEESFAKKLLVASEEAEKWLNAYIERNGIDFRALTKGQLCILSREVPCTIRCWRISLPVDVKPGEVCPECGKLVPPRTAWEKLARDEDAF